MRRFRTSILLLAVAALLPATALSQNFAIGEDDTEATVRARVRENATYYLGSEGFGMDDVRKFRAAIQAGVKRARSAAAPQLSTYVGEKAETPSYLSSSKAADLIDAFRLLHLVGVAEEELATVLDRVVEDYDGRMSRIEAYATELDATLARMYENNDRILGLVGDAYANVELAQDSAESLVGVMETYRSIIERQGELLEDQIDLTPERSPTVSLLAGPNWYYGQSTDIADFGLAAGALVQFPLFRSLTVGVAALTSFPPSSSLIALQFGFMPIE